MSGSGLAEIIGIFWFDVLTLVLPFVGVVVLAGVAVWSLRANNRQVREMVARQMLNQERQRKYRLLYQTSAWASAWLVFYRTLLAVEATRLSPMSKKQFAKLWNLDAVAIWLPEGASIRYQDEKERELFWRWYRPVATTHFHMAQQGASLLWPDWIQSCAEVFAEYHFVEQYNAVLTCLRSAESLDRLCCTRKDSNGRVLSLPMWRRYFARAIKQRNTTTRKFKAFRKFLEEIRTKEGL